MSNETFISAGQTYNMTINPAPTDGKKYPVKFLIHGNAGLVAPFGNQIHDFAKDLADLGYLTVVPQYYTDNDSHLMDAEPHNQTRADAIAAVATRQDADMNRLGLIGFSLGATTAMTYIASNPQGTVKVLADFFGFLTSTIKNQVAKFPPTIILHNGKDKIIVDVANSIDLDSLLSKDNVVHLFVPPYDDNWPEVLHHPFKPGEFADVDSRRQTTNWFVNHLPPIGI